MIRTTMLLPLSLSPPSSRHCPSSPSLPLSLGVSLASLLNTHPSLSSFLSFFLTRSLKPTFPVMDLDVPLISLLPSLSSQMDQSSSPFVIISLSPLPTFSWEIPTPSRPSNSLGFMLVPLSHSLTLSLSLPLSLSLSPLSIFSLSIVPQPPLSFLLCLIRSLGK